MLLKKHAYMLAWGAIAAGAALLLFLTANRAPAPELVALAQCLAEKGVTMYGAAWCPHCQKEKREFGKAFRYVPYVECPENPERCLSLHVTGYPTWIFPDGYSPTGSPVKGKRLVGEQGLTRLSEASGCPLEENPTGEVR